jgi:hypothetical protein
MADWINLSLPYQPGTAKQDDSEVTDCRVVDEDQDTHAGMTVAAKALIASANLYSTSVNGSVLWGKVDLSGNKKHYGVNADSEDSASSVVACVGSSLLCDVSTAAACSAYRTVDGNLVRSNVVDVAPLDNAVPQDGGDWTCEAVIANKGNLFAGRSNNSSNYPPPSDCPFLQ